MLRLLPRTAVLLAALSGAPVLLVALTAPAHAQSGSFDLERQMKQMKTAYFQAANSQNMADFKTAYLQFKVLSTQASKQPFDGNADEQAIYQQGMTSLLQHYQPIDVAVAKNDLVAAKAALALLRDVQKTYHKKLDV